MNIANYKIRFENPAGDIELIPSERFTCFLSDTERYDVCIRVFSGETELPAAAVKVFSAPYIEEINGLRIKKNDKFWSVHKKDDSLYILTEFPFSADKRSGMLRFSLESKYWDLFLKVGTVQTDPIPQDGQVSTAGQLPQNDQLHGTSYIPQDGPSGPAGKTVPGSLSAPAGRIITADPMDYPLDGLILYYLTVIHGDIMIHASGIHFQGKGFIFSGISGKGKTTMAELWDSHGARVIHDDRLIIRRTRNFYSMFNTPVYRNDEARESPLDAIFIIEHGTENEALPLKGVKAITSLLSNCIQHNWGKSIIRQSLDAAIRICTDLPVYQLRFRPDHSVTDYLLRHSKKYGGKLKADQGEKHETKYKKEPVKNTEKTQDMPKKKHETKYGKEQD